MVEDEARAAALLKKGCAGGDARSCAMANALAPRGAEEAVAKSQSAAPAPAPKARASEAAESHDNVAGFALVGLAAVAVGGAVVMGMPMPEQHARGSNRHALVDAAPASSSRTGLVIGLSAAAAISATTGMVLLFSRHSEPEKPKVNVGLSPGGLVVSGTMP